MSRSLHPDASPGLLLWRVTLAWQRRITAALRPLDLTHVQFVLLMSTWWLVTKGCEQPTQRRLAEFAGVDAMMTSQVLRTLEGKGLVTRRSDVNDARAKVIAVTPAGAKLAGRAVAVVESVDSEFFKAADPRLVLDVLTQLDSTRDAD